MMRLVAVILAVAMMLGIGGCIERREQTDTGPARLTDDTFPVPQIVYGPKSYICCRIDTPLTIDGRLTESAWDEAPLTDAFVDIEGDIKPIPRFVTRAKMLWDEDYFYIAGIMEEPQVWATLKNRDDIIYHDNDFEVFIDPNGDTHEYYELEVNAFATPWDLFLLKPYRDGGPALHAWDIRGLKVAVSVDGTINNPRDVDGGWIVEIAIPWSILKECAYKSAPPLDGDIWRVNFSRVEWQVTTEDRGYVKITDSITGQPVPEDNWVWSPQGLINMHYPEMWGYVKFSKRPPGTMRASFVPDETDEQARWAMRRLYYAQRTHRMQYGGYTSSLDRLGLDDVVLIGYPWPPRIRLAGDYYKVILTGSGGFPDLHMTGDGKIWEEYPPPR